MGAGQSTETHLPSQALHVLRVTPSSPASQTDIEPFFDFIVGFEGDSFETHSNIDVNELEKIVESHEGRVLNLIVWSSKNEDARVVPIIPSRKWSQLDEENELNVQPSLLGLSMRMCTPGFPVVWHVLDVLEGSPAESAGLVPYGDYIIGWSGGELSTENDFYELVEAHVDKPLRVYVYSHDFDALREVVLVPNRHWGGEGLLGCVFGFGLLHRIPPQNLEHLPGSTPPELAEEDGYHEEQLFVPADMHAESSISRVSEWPHQESWDRENSISFRGTDSTFSQSQSLETAVPGHEAMDRFNEEEEESISPSQETPRRPSPLTHMSSPGFKRATASPLSSPLMNGPTKNFFPLNDHERSSFRPYSMTAAGRPDDEDSSDYAERASVADTDASHGSGSLTSVD